MCGADGKSEYYYYEEDIVKPEDKDNKTDKIYEYEYYYGEDPLPLPNIAKPTSEPPKKPLFSTKSMSSKRASKETDYNEQKNIKSVDSGIALLP